MTAGEAARRADPEQWYARYTTAPPSFDRFGTHGLRAGVLPDGRVVRRVWVHVEVMEDQRNVYLQGLHWFAVPGRVAEMVERGTILLDPENEDVREEGTG